MKRIILLCAIPFLIGMSGFSKSLLVVRCKPNSQGLPMSQRLYTYQLRDGEIAKGKLVFSSETIRFDSDELRLYRDRYLLTGAYVIDIVDGQMIHESMGDFVAFDGDRILFKESRVEIHDNKPLEIRGIFALNLTTGMYSKVKEETKWDWPGILCPWGDYSMSTELEDISMVKAGQNGNPYGEDIFEGKSALVLHDKNGDRLIAEDLTTEHSVLSSYKPEPQFFWFDEESLITQNGNGHIIRVFLDGRVETIVKFQPARLPTSRVHMRRESDGTVTYECANQQFNINVSSKTVTESAPRDLPTLRMLDNDFSAMKLADGEGYSINHNGERIGTVGDLGWRVRTMKGAIAIAVYSKDRNISGMADLRIWDAESGKWSAIKLYDLIELVGWIEE